MKNPNMEYEPVKKETGMQIPKACPKCGAFQLNRSHSKNIFEKGLKIILPIKTYRCHACHWRGWVSNRKITQKVSLRKTILVYFAVIVISLIVANVLRIMILQ